MKIGIDARTILSPEKGEAIGVGHYTYQLIRYLLEMDQKNEYVLFFDFRVREKDVKKFSRPNVKIRFYPFSDYKKYLPGAYNEILGAATLHRENMDVLHATSPMSRIPLSYRGKTIVTIHDLAVFKVPDVFPRFYRTKTKAVVNLMAGKADTIIAASNSTKKDLEQVLGCDPKKIEVVYGGLDKRFFDEPKLSREKVLEQYGIKEKYLLFLGTIEPVKNLTRLFEAFKLFRDWCTRQHSKCDYKLVIGGKRGWLAKEYKQIAKDMEIDKSIMFTGYVIGDELVPLFKNAEAFVMPSLYEGFGTTVIEALAAGIPTIASNVSSIPEIAGDAAILVNPNNVQEIFEAMKRVIQDESLRNTLIEKGREQAKKFDWEKCARETLAIYEKFAK